MCVSHCCPPPGASRGGDGDGVNKVPHNTWGGGEEEAVFTRESITNEDPPNAQKAQHRPNPRFDECVASVLGGAPIQLQFRITRQQPPLWTVAFCYLNGTVHAQDTVNLYLASTNRVPRTSSTAFFKSSSQLLVTGRFTHHLSSRREGKLACWFYAAQCSF